METKKNQVDKHKIEFSDMVLDWYREGYRCNLVPKPTDTNKLKLAIKASIVERMVEVFNSPPHNSDQTAPEWCDDIGPVNKPIKLESERLLEGEKYCRVFEKRNLIVVKNFMFFV